MRHRIAPLLAAPALLAGLVMVPAAEATTAPVPARDGGVRCSLYRSSYDVSIARCHDSRTYQHWIRCRDRDRRVEIEVTRRFHGTNSRLACPRNYELINHAVGV
ncbi:hypothetical protein [Thermomonospora catenispora]|uniref:hypothetical protein n=1 Tax=Thermomonospora catenispora TaxID=2493090 RepID=UPI00112187E5|nr:hypothetical protein [Thermomonospora catenispora]TNY36539.1 hypothetical protein EIO00_12125 [Thermomonospora catenispora]